ncbi:MAG TPA: cell division protein FtsA [Candidatus Woesebacteria bacterium]|mgnify:CR=1 FL=1|nr:cell division protein FtsA [Candidatus Woesebacteria bacterium]
MQHSKIINVIDIGTSKITTLVGQYFEDEDKFNIVAVSSIPSLGFRKGQIINLEQASHTITQSIESAERMAGFQINSAHISISAPHIESINSHGVVAISNPNGEIDLNDINRVTEAAKAISLPTGKEIIHIIQRKFTVDGQEGVIDPVGMNGIRLEVEAHLVLASSPALKNLKKCLEDIGIKIESLTYAGLSTATAALTDTEKELGVALVDIGGSITNITIFSEGSPVFSSVIPVGANNVTNDIAIGLRFSIEDAEKIKLKLTKLAETKKFEDEVELSHFDIHSDDKKKISLQMAINGIIKPRLEEIFSLIYSQIETSGFSQTIPAGIVLTGGGAMTVNAKEICNKIIPLPLRIADPPKVGGVVDDIINPAYTSTIGLLIHNKNTKKNSGSNIKAPKVSMGGFIGKLKKILEPLLP